MDGGQSVGQSGRDSRFPERVAQACGAVAIAIALLALTGWSTGRLILASFHTDLIPMSPTTALASLLLGGALLVGDRQRAHPRSRWLACAAAAMVLLIGLLIFGQHLTGTNLGFEHWLSRSSATFGQVPIGRMSPMGAGTFVVASLAMLTLLASPTGWRLAHESAASAAVGVMVVGVLVALGYWRGVAFLSGGSLIPMALPTALECVLLGAGILVGGGPRVWTMRDYRPVAVGFTVGLAASILLFALANWQERDRIHVEFERKADVLAFTFVNALDGNLMELKNIRALYAISLSVDRSAFQTFVSRILARRPSIQAFSWSPYVTDRERAGYEARARRDGIPAYQFTERSSDGRLVPAQRRPAYVPVFYQEPYAGNEATLGFDNLSHTARRATLEKARDTGQAVATEPISLVQGTGQGMGILICQPIYKVGKPVATLAQRRSNLLGFAVEIVHLDHLIRTSLPHLEREGLEYRLVDTTATLHEDLIMASAGAEEAVRAGYRFDQWIEMADRRWRLEVYAAPWYLAAKQSGQAWAVLASGLFLTILLGTYLLASARRAAEVTLLAESLRKISRAVEHSPAAVVITDTQGAIEYVNPKFTQVSGYDAEEVRGQNPRILKSGETSPEEYQRLWATITAGGEWRGEFHNRKKNGELFWEAASISPVRSPDGHITHFVAIKEDITERKRNEEAARRHAQQLETIRAVGIEITRELDLGALLHLITDRVVELIGGGQSMIRLWDEDGQLLAPRAYAGNDAHWGDRRLRLGEGVAGTAAQRRQGMIVNDFRTSPYAIPLLTEGTTHTAVLAEPLLFGDRLVGVLSITREADQQPFAEKDRQLLALFATQAAIAIENARLHEATVRRGEQLETLRAVSIEITRELDLGALLHLITDRVMELIGGGQSRIRLWDEDGQCLVPGAYTGSDAHWGDRRLRLGEGVAGTAAQQRQGIIVNDFRTSPYAIPLLTEGTTHTAVLAEPLLFGDRLVGVLTITRKADQQPFTEKDRELLALFAAQAAIAIENGRLHETAVRHGAQMEALLQSLETITSGLELREILDRILGEAIRISGEPHVKVLLLDKTSKALRVGAIRGSGMPPADALPAGASLSGLVAQSGEPLFIADAQNDPRNLWRERDRELGIVTYLGLPIKKGEEVLGVLTFNTTVPYRYSPEEMILLTSFAAQAAIAIENARLHEEVIQHATTLEARVRERTTELAHMNLELTAALRQAEAGSQAKNDFLINMSHELRTPLNSVLGFAHLLQEQLASQLNPKQMRFLTNISNSGQHLLALVNEILDLDTAEVGRLTLHLTKVNLADVITEALDATREAVRQKGHSVHVLIPPDLPVFDADRDRIRQIAICLLSNAVKFTPDGGTITVAARRISNLQFAICDLKDIGSEPQSQIANQKSQISPPPPQSQIANCKLQMPDFVEIAVADTGIGIGAEDLPRLFRMFGQLESPLTKRYEGTGVGLALTKRLVELHGGTITAASDGEGLGSTFTVRLPVEQGG